MGDFHRIELNRRAFLAGLVAAAVAGAAGCSGDDSDDEAAASLDEEGLNSEPLPPLPTDLPTDLFALGVASGDPVADSVILWTRIVADPTADDGGVGSAPIPVGWELATDREFEEVVASGDAVADPALAHAVHVDASALEPDTWYWYRFTVGDRVSPVGRTRTTPSTGSEPESLRFAFASCQNRQDGYWTAHRHLAEEDVDLVLFLGDYIYEGPSDPASLQPYASEAPVDLATYRKRWAEYKGDPAIQVAHARCPWVCTWDDHEVENNYADDVAEAASPDDTDAQEQFRQRRGAAYLAFYEHTPVRLDPPEGANFRIYRGVRWGTLARFFVLDGRQYRSNQECDATQVFAGVGPLCAAATDEARSMLGEAQEEWLGEGLAETEATWNVLAQQTVMSPVPFADGVVNLDQWDGYPAARRRLVDQLREVRNPVVITGDIHLSAVGYIGDDPDDPTTAPLVTEVVGTSISSNFPLADVVEGLVTGLPNVEYLNARQRGYVVCDVSPGELRAEFRYVSTVEQPEAEIETGATWLVTDGDPQPREA
ncbi:MAG: alkaline phosphatase D family protein [Acidimicrobiales bacterium]